MEELFYEIRAEFSNATLKAGIDDVVRAEVDDILKKVIETKVEFKNL